MELARSTFRTAFEHGRHRFWFLLTTALIVFIPLGLLETISHGVEINTDDGIDPIDLLRAVSIALAALLGEVFYAGTIASVVAKGPEFEPTFGGLIRSIPWLTIIAIDLIFAFSVAFGLVALFIPGLYIYGRWVLAATLADIDHVRTREALRRSAALTKGHRVVVVTVLFAVMIVSEILSEAFQHVIEALEGEDLVAEWISASGSAIILSPIFALLCAAFVIELRARKAPAAPETSAL